MAKAPIGLGILSLLLGIASLVCQILVMTVNNFDTGEGYGVGIWCGIVFVVSGLAVMLARKIKFIVVIVSTVSLVCAVALAAIASYFLARLFLELDCGEISETNLFYDYCVSHIIFHSILVATGALGLIFYSILLHIAFKKSSILA